VFWRVCNPMAALSMVRGLRPDDSPVWIRDVLAFETQDVLLVGHLPHLPALLRQLTGDERWPLHGLVWLERCEGRWNEKWRAAPDA
jgi:phosphohistidine phosphatase SixA